MTHNRRQKQFIYKLWWNSTNTNKNRIWSHLLRM